MTLLVWLNCLFFHKPVLLLFITMLLFKNRYYSNTDSLICRQFDGDPALLCSGLQPHICTLCILCIYICTHTHMHTQPKQPTHTNTRPAHRTRPQGAPGWRLRNQVPASPSAPPPCAPPRCAATGPLGRMGTPGSVHLRGPGRSLLLSLAGGRRAAPCPSGLCGLRTLACPSSPRWGCCLCRGLPGPRLRWGAPRPLRTGASPTSEAAAPPATSPAAEEATTAVPTTPRPAPGRSLTWGSGRQVPGPVPRP